MAGGWLPDFLRRLRQRLSAADEGTADADLLNRFLERRDEAAFEALVGRHGSMVLGVCGRVLGDAHAAEDAFQATFLILARRARAIRKQTSLGCWLHGVAYRAALKARAREACRRRHEREAMVPEPTDPARDVLWRDLRPVLDAALDRLPEKYRVPLVLCYLEGRTQQEAARLLGWQLGTLATRVLRGRARLRSLLTRRGVALSVAGLTVALERGPALAEVPAALVRSTVGHAACVAAGSSAAGTVPVSIQVLVTGVLHTMRYAKIRKAVAVATAAILLSGAALIWQQGPTRATGGDPPADKKDGDKAGDKKDGEKPGAKKDLELLQGTWNIDSMEWGGKSLPKELMTGYKFVFDGNKLSWEAAIGIMSRAGKISAIDDAVHPCEFKIDPGQDPKQIDITLQLKRGDRTLLGIYEIKDDTLKVCYFASNNGRRPTEFATKEGVNTGLIVLTRAKK
jgi:RNA polymerase sigma factor (sigma-70 family)